MQHGDPARERGAGAYISHVARSVYELLGSVSRMVELQRRATLMIETAAAIALAKKLAIAWKGAQLLEALSTDDESEDADDD